MAIRGTQGTQCLCRASTHTGLEITSDTSVIRGILCLVPQSEDACPAVNGAEMLCNVRILYKTKYFEQDGENKLVAMKFHVARLMCCSSMSNA